MRMQCSKYSPGSPVRAGGGACTGVLLLGRLSQPDRPSVAPYAGAAFASVVLKEGGPEELLAVVSAICGQTVVRGRLWMSPVTSLESLDELGHVTIKIRPSGSRDMDV